MKKLFALLLAAALLLGLAACGNSGSEGTPAGDTPKETLETFEMTAEILGVEEPAKATIGYPKSFTMKENDWNVVLTNAEKDVELEVYLLNDYDCYAVNQEYAKEEYFFYEEATFGSYKGYACRMDEASAAIDVFVYLGCVAEMDDVYVSFTIGSASRDLDADPMTLYKLEEVKQILDSVVYTAPAVSEG